MFDGACTVTFDGDHEGTYYVACTYVQYIDDELKNTGSTTITLYPVFRDGTNQNTISISAVSYPQWVPTGSSQRTYITNATNVTFNATGNIYRNLPYIELFVWFTVAVACLFYACRR